MNIGKIREIGLIYALIHFGDAEPGQYYNISKRPGGKQSKYLNNCNLLYHFKQKLDQRHLIFLYKFSSWQLKLTFPINLRIKQVKTKMFNVLLIILIIFYKYKQNFFMLAEKTYFGCMDYRNSKFQGSIRQNSPEGIGMVLDVEFMLCLSNWKNQTPNGPSLLVFPNRDYFYGNFKNRQPLDICSYVTATGEVYFLNFINGAAAETIVYIDNNSTIIQLDTSKNQQKVKSYVREREVEDKWRVISGILKGNATEDYQDYKAYLKATLLRDMGDVLQCSENAGLTFIGFKDTISLGVKFDKNNRVRQIGNFEEFPRNIQYGKKFSFNSNNQMKVEQGKFSSPQEVYVYKNDRRTLESIKQTQNYFKKGTNFKNQFLKMNTFIELSKYCKQIKDLSMNIKSLQFGQKIMYSLQTQQHQQSDLAKQYDLEVVKRDIYNAANRKAKNTSRSPLRSYNQEFSNETDYKRTSRKNSNEKNAYYEPQRAKPLKRSKDKYKYTNQFKPAEGSYNVPPIQPDYALKYRDAVPQVSDFDRNLGAYFRNNVFVDPVPEALKQQKLIKMRIEQLKREEELLKRYEEARIPSSPIHTLFPLQAIRNRSISPIKPALHDVEPRFERSHQAVQSKYQNYINYKNRNKTENDRGNDRPSPDKINDYQRKALEQRNLTPEKGNNLFEKPKNIPSPEQLTLNPNKNPQKLPGRYKKTFKYLQ